jgi:hypothetical protein
MANALTSRFMISSIAAHAAPARRCAGAVLLNGLDDDCDSLTAANAGGAKSVPLVLSP